MLVYDSKEVNLETFDSKGKDLSKLVGSCKCGKVIRGREAIPHRDPYNFEINDDFTLIVQCETCEKFRREEI